MTNENTTQSEFSFYKSGAKHSTLDDKGNYTEWYENGNLKLKTTSEETLCYDEKGNITKVPHSEFYKNNPEVLAQKNKIRFLLDCGDKKVAQEELGRLCRCIAVPPQFQSRVADHCNESRYPLIHWQNDNSFKRMQAVVLEDGKIALGEIYSDEKYINHPIEVQNNGIEWMWRLRGSIIDVDKGTVLWQESSPRSVCVRDKTDPDRDLWGKISSNLVTVSTDDDKKINFHMAIYENSFPPIKGSILSSLETSLKELQEQQQNYQTSSFMEEYLYDMRRLTDKSFNAEEIRKEREKAEQEKLKASILQNKGNYQTKQRIKKQKLIDTALSKKIHQ